MTAVEARSIRVLPPRVASSIAAGEVVERPVSVVRELLDNAIDAGARRIALDVEEGGIALIRVVDDGLGIRPEEVELAFERHATSKISSADDLRRIRTLGFRGEALPAIAAASDVEIVSRAEHEPVAVHLALAGGAVVRRTSRSAPQGTSIAVRDLFKRVPARRAFLASPQAEARRITVLVSHYALAYPGIAFRLRVHGRRVLSTAGAGDMRTAFSAVYGADDAAAMLDVALDEGALSVGGLAGSPSLHRGNRSGISMFINGRWIQSRPLGFAVTDAYANELPTGRFPVVSLAISLPEDEVDVNVHPAKAEVRFRDERAVGRAVRRAVRAALDAAAPVEWSPPPAGAPAGPSLRDRLQPLALQAQPAQGELRWQPEPRPGETPRPVPGTHRDVLPMLRVVGQLGLTYIVAEGPDGMYLIDQHAAHERVLFDRLVRRTEAAAASQPLLEPRAIELDPALVAVLDEHIDHLRSMGMDLEPFGERAYQLRAVPAALAGSDDEATLRNLLEQLGEERRVTEPFGRAAATVACHGSVRAGMALAIEEMCRLVEDLEATESPRTCPHGRPTVVHMRTEALERQFGRR